MSKLLSKKVILQYLTQGINYYKYQEEAEHVKTNLHTPVRKDSIHFST